MTIAETLISGGRAEGNDTGCRSRAEIVPGLADLRYLSFKCYVKLEQVMQFRASARDQTENVEQAGDFRLEDPLMKSIRQLPLEEKRTLWEASIRPATSETERPIIRGYWRFGREQASRLGQ